MKGGNFPRVCVTRALKNARQLQRLAPELFAPREPDEGFLSILPSAVLGRLHHRPVPAEVLYHPRVTPRIVRLPLAQVQNASKAPLFSGTLHFVAAKFTTSSGTREIAAKDLSVAIEYAGLASKPISAYATQYGPNNVTIATAPIPLALALPGGTFNDSLLQTWVNDLVTRGGVPASGAVVFLSPTGVLNTDAPVDQGVLGYHGKATVPYAFVNALGSGFQLADPTDLFALALSHEIAEMVVDPAADGSNPECCDGCGPNCQAVLRDYFDAGGLYLKTGTTFPPEIPYALFINAIAQPSMANQCPAPVAACAYAPPSLN